MQTQGLEKFSMADSQSVRDKARAEVRASQGRDAGAGLWKALGPLASILGGLRVSSGHRGRVQWRGISLFSTRQLLPVAHQYLVSKLEEPLVLLLSQVWV